MNFVEGKTIERKGLYSKKFISDDLLDIDTIIDILKKYENEDTKMFDCRCSTFTEKGNTVSHRYRNMDELQKMHNYPNPSIGIDATYINPYDMSYKFSITTANNTNSLSIEIYDKTAEYVKKQIELDKMEAEAEKKTQEEQKINDEGYQK